jgi:hypothetical protein
MIIPTHTFSQKKTMGKAKRQKNRKTSVPDLPEPFYNVRISSHFLAMYLSVEHSKEVALLCMGDIPSWERRYPPVEEHAGTVKEIFVACYGDLALVGIVPFSNSPNLSQ